MVASVLSSRLECWRYLLGSQTLPSTVRVPDDIYEALRQIRIQLESQHQSAAPAMQDLVSVALERFLKDWNDSNTNEELLSELLEHRKAARSRMGRKQSDNTELNN